MVTIGQATEGDAETIAEMLVETETYYGATDIPQAADLVAQVHNALFGERPMATVLLASDGEQVVGLASYTFLWPAAGADASLYLKEMFVLESARRRGVAGAFMAALRSVAEEAGCSRVEWTADRDNPPALAFYEAFGAERRDGKVFYRWES
ncbi:GNAT family N-acetyltransferase [Streptomyces sp. H10-C2]|uniref:GNAT family N-acetyltransferase n=1 Tax=unclassified Streptomyces TaxID=2593676 RepID=UPI0024BA520B|nr:MULTISPECIES: GNAT family N-acetyltransferase [unclassified Streptomyces]MDJ0345224.1 GNAT family N-acetyltransferase [Streptomyces sp. PH10-H1]MDJ0368830.1 GNAT family N-acetyltransferase [Streptomyces sp. H10-C2]